MALEDFDSHDSADSGAPAPSTTPVAAHVPTPVAVPVAAPARKPVNPDDEDLFDFPVVEMKLEAEAAKKPAPPPAKPVAESAPAPNSPAPAAAAVASAPAAAGKAAPQKGAEGEAKTQEKDVAKAAQLVEDIEQVLGADGRKRKRGRLLRGPSTLTLVGIAALVLTNVFGLLFVWRTSQSFQTGVQAMNEQFAETLRRQTLAPAQPAPAPDSTHASEAGGVHAPAPLEAFEKSALQMAREEIGAGEYAAARRRLSRLLATADRIEAEEREDIEAQAAFLIASTYRKQADAAREEKP